MDQANDILCRALARPKELTFMFGAGVSMPAPVSIPTVYALYSRLLELAGVSDQLNGAIWRKIDSIRPQPRFEVFVHHLQQEIDTELRFAEVFNADAFNSIHAFVADLIQAGACAITTNFDRCVELAGGERCDVIAYDGTDLEKPAFGNLLLKPHGSIGDQRRQLVITDQALSRTAGGFKLLPNWRTTLLDAINGRTLLVLGYSGSDDFDLTPLLAQSRPREILWVSYDAHDLRLTSKALTGPISEALCRQPLTVLQGDVQHFIERHGEARSGQPAQARDLDSILRPILDSPLHKRKLVRLFLRHFCCFEELLETAAPTPIGDNGRDHTFALYNLAHYKQCIDYADECAIESNLGADDHWKIQYYRTSALIMSGRFTDAREVAISMAHRFAEIGDARYRCDWQNLCGSAWFMSANYEEALSVYRAAHVLAIETGNLEGVATALWGIAICRDKLGELREAVDGYIEALSIFDALGKLSSCVTLHRNIADAFLNLGDYGRARSHTGQAQTLVAPINQKHNDIYVYLTKIKFAIIDNREDEYQRLAAAALSMFKDGIATTLAVEFVVALALGHIDRDFSLETIRYREFLEFLAQSVDPGHPITVLGSEELLPLLHAPARHRQVALALVQRFRFVIIKSDAYLQASA